jgi:hypothetical protein
MSLKQLFNDWKNKTPSESVAFAALVSGIVTAAECSEAEAAAVLTSPHLTAETIGIVVEGVRLAAQARSLAAKMAVGSKLKK